MPHKIELKEFGFSVSCDSFFSKRQKYIQDGKTPFFLFSYNAFPEFDLGDEISGESTSLAELTALSAECAATVFCGVTTRISGLKHISVAVCHKGRLVDIVDRTSNPASDAYASGDKIKVFSTDYGRVAVLVDKDVLSEKNWAKVSGVSDLVVGVLKDGSELFTQAAAALSERFNKPLIYTDGENIIWREY